MPKIEITVFTCLYIMMDLDVKHHMTLWERYAGNSDRPMNFSRNKYNYMCIENKTHLTNQTYTIQKGSHTLGK